MNDELRARARLRAVSGNVTPLGSALPPLGTRDVGFEWELTRQAAATMRVDGSELSAFADMRAKAGPVMGLPGRNLAREALEELADARNYIVWRQTELYRGATPDAEQVQALNEALAHVAAAHERVNFARLRDAA